MAFAIAHYKIKYPKIKAFSRMHRWDVYFEESTINYLPFRKFIFTQMDYVFSISENGIMYSENKLKTKFNSIALSIWE